MNKISSNVKTKIPGWIIDQSDENFSLFLKMFYKWSECVKLTLNYTNSNIEYFQVGSLIKGKNSSTIGIIRYIDYSNNTLLIDIQDKKTFMIDESFINLSGSSTYGILKITYTISESMENVVKGDTLIVDSTGFSSTVLYNDYANRTIYVMRTNENSIDVDDLISSSTNSSTVLTYEYIKIEDIKYNFTAAKNNLLHIRDIDNTIDTFIEHFKYEFANNIPDNALIDKRFMIKHIKEFYQAKGSEDAYKFLFNILYNEPASIEYPGDKIFRPSDNYWAKFKTLRITDIGGSTSFKGRPIIGQMSGSTAICEFEMSYKIGKVLVKDLFLKYDSVYGTFMRDEVISTNDGNTASIAKLYNVISDFTIENKGTQYEVNDVLNISPSQFSEAKVGSITEGPIEKIVITSGGTGYIVGDELVFNNTGCQGTFFETASAKVSKVDGSGVIQEINITNYGKGYVKFPTITVSSTGGSSASLTAYGSNIGGIKTINIVSNGLEFRTVPTITITSTNGSDGSITCNINCTFDSEGDYRNNKSFLSDDIHIQDGYYYQKYSYIVRVGIAMNKWRNIIKKLTHPAGMELFSILDVNSLINNELKKKYTYFNLDNALLYIYFDDADCMNPYIYFRDENGNGYPTSHMNLNEVPYYKHYNVWIYGIDLNEPVGITNTRSSGPIIHI